jgi:hypothetical protein
MSTGSNSDARAEGRRALRKTMRTLGEIVADGAQRSIECTVLDMSSTGARLKVGGAVRKAFEPALNIPETFALHVTRDNISVECRLAWREKDMIGVSFTSTFKSLRAAKRA